VVKIEVFAGVVILVLTVTGAEVEVEVFNDVVIVVISAVVGRVEEGGEDVAAPIIPNSKPPPATIPQPKIRLFLIAFTISIIKPAMNAKNPRIPTTTIFFSSLFSSDIEGVLR